MSKEDEERFNKFIKRAYHPYKPDDSGFSPATKEEIMIEVKQNSIDRLTTLIETTTDAKTRDNILKEIGLLQDSIDQIREKQRGKE